MPYYKDAQPMYAQQNPQRVTPLSQEMYAPPQYLQTTAPSSETNQITDFVTKYWWIIALVLIVLVFVIYMWYYGSNKSNERIVEF